MFSLTVSLCFVYSFVTIVPFSVMLTFFIWGWFYVTFGPFLQSRYALNDVQFGAYMTFIEFIGNGIAMMLYIYFGSIFVSKSKKTKIVETEILVLVSSIILFVSFLCISLILHLPHCKWCYSARPLLEF